MSVPDILVALQPVINALENLSVPYFIGGSIASSLYGYELGERVSPRQWLDVLGVIKVQALDLDKKYLLEWGKKLGLLELLQKAFLEPGIEFE